MYVQGKDSRELALMCGMLGHHMVVWVWNTLHDNMAPSMVNASHSHLSHVHIEYGHFGYLIDYLIRNKLVEFVLLSWWLTLVGTG